MFRTLFRKLALGKKRRHLLVIFACVVGTLTIFPSLATFFWPTTQLCICQNLNHDGSFAVLTSKTITTIINQTKTNNSLTKNDSKPANGTGKVEVKKTKDKKKSATVPNNYVDFKLILPFIEPNLDPKQRTLYVAVVVNSAANGKKHRNLRQAIRQTWGNTTIPETGNTTLPTRPWKLFFSLGIAENETERKANLNEAREYNDIIIGNFTDTYRNVVIKTFMAHFWAVTKLSCDYVLKTDDDVYVRVPGLISWLQRSGSPREFFGGMISKFHTVPRDPKSPWYITREQFSEKKWPPWCHGSFHVLSADIIPNYLIHTYKRKPFHADDAYLGVASKDLRVRVNQIPGFTVDHLNPRRKRPEKELRNILTFGHKLTPEDMTQYYQFYRDNDLLML